MSIDRKRSHRRGHEEKTMKNYFRYDYEFDPLANNYYNVCTITYHMCRSIYIYTYVCICMCMYYYVSELVSS